MRISNVSILRKITQNIVNFGKNVEQPGLLVDLYSS